MQVSLTEVLAENYFGPGWTAAGVVGSIIDDLNQGRFDDEWITEIESTREELGFALTQLVLDLFPITSGYSESTTPGTVKELR